MNLLHQVFFLPGGLSEASATGDEVTVTITLFYVSF